MKKEIAEKWVADLRTNPPQAKKRLYDGKGYCCLGRLCLLLGLEFRRQGECNKYLPYRDENIVGGGAVLPEEIQDLAGMHSDNGAHRYRFDTLSSMNDSGKSFAEIANIIEQEWKNL